MDSARTRTSEYDTGDDDEATVTKQRPPKRRKVQKQTTSHEQLVATAKSRSTGARKKRPRASRPVGPDPVDDGLPSHLRDLEEDIVDDPGNVTTAEVNIVDPKATVAVMRSEPTEKLYTETKRGFKSADKTKVARKRAQAAEAGAQQPLDTQRRSTIEFALSTHRVFKSCAVFIQGLFSGLTLWQIIASYMLLVAGTTVFVEYYFMLGFPVHCIYFFMFAVATVSSLDRYDLARPTRKLLIKSITLQAGTICILFYFAGLIISLSTASLDERIGLRDASLFPNETLTNGCQWSCQWQILNVIRGVLAILGWFVVALRPNTDRLTKSLLSANDDILQPSTVTANLTTANYNMTTQNRQQATMT
jgi:hypothetical protein